MSPPASLPLAAEIGEYWTDEGIFLSLLNFKNGSPLPSNVKSDLNPYQCRPSDLPADLWYLCSRVKKDAECGFWLETGEACEMFSNSDILGLRTTLQFYQRQVPHERKTDWVMQEYRITDKSKNSLKDDRALCRVFLADEYRPPSRNSIADIDVKISINLEPKIVSNVNSRGHISTSEHLEKTMDNNTGPSLMTRRSPDPFLENSSEMDCILRGDYFELNDLVDPEYRSSSSSCLTMTSEEYFDSMALLRELEDDVTDREMKDASVKFNLSAPAKSKEVVICPAVSVSLRNGGECKSFAEMASNRNESTSNGANKTSCSSNSESTSKEGKKGTKRRKMMKYLCFLAF